MRARMTGGRLFRCDPSPVCCMLRATAAVSNLDLALLFHQLFGRWLWMSWLSHRWPSDWARPYSSDAEMLLWQSAFGRLNMNLLITALHVMQTRYCDENSVRRSVCPSVTRVNCDKTVERSVQIYTPYERTFSLVFW